MQKSPHTKVIKKPQNTSIPLPSGGIIPKPRQFMFTHNVFLKSYNISLSPRKILTTKLWHTVDYKMYRKALILFLINHGFCGCWAVPYHYYKSSIMISLYHYKVIRYTYAYEKYPTVQAGPRQYAEVLPPTLHSKRLVFSLCATTCGPVTQY